MRRQPKIKLEVHRLGGIGQVHLASKWRPTRPAQGGGWFLGVLTVTPADTAVTGLQETGMYARSEDRLEAKASDKLAKWEERSGCCEGRAVLETCPCRGPDPRKKKKTRGPE